MVVREFFATLGLKVDTGSAKKANDILESLKRSAISLVEAYASVRGAKALYDIVDSTAKVAAELINLSQRFGIATEQFQKFQYAAGQGLVSAEEFAFGMRYLERNLYEATQGNVEAQKNFARLGISVRDTNGHLKHSQDILLEVADAMKNEASESKRVAIAQALFGRAGATMIPFLRQGAASIRAEGEEAKKLGGIISEDLIAKSREYITTQKKLAFAIQGVKNLIAQELMPAITDVMKHMIEWIKANGKILSQIPYFFMHVVRTAKAFAELAYYIGETVVSLSHAAAEMIAGEKYALAFAFAVGILAAAWTSPVIAIGLFVAAIALLYEDFQEFVNKTGRHTFFGDIVEWLQGFADIHIKEGGVLGFFARIASSIVSITQDWKEFKESLTDQSWADLLVSNPLFRFQKWWEEYVKPWIEAHRETRTPSQKIEDIFGMKTVPNPNPSNTGGSVSDNPTFINNIQIDYSAGGTSENPTGAVSNNLETLSSAIKAALDESNRKAYDRFRNGPFRINQNP